MAVFLSCICKVEPEEEDDADVDEQDPHLLSNEAWAVHKKGTNS